MSKFRLFALSLLVTTGVLTAVIYATRVKSPRLRGVGEDVFLTSQLEPENVRGLRFRVKTIVDLRPDGEAKDQPSSAEIASASKVQGLRFHYIPVPHEGIPDAAVDELAGVLATDPKPVLLYCRTGRRAARTLALAEASRPDGPGVDKICEMVTSAGFSADDLRGAIEERVATRENTAILNQ